MNRLFLNLNWAGNKQYKGFSVLSPLTEFAFLILFRYTRVSRHETNFNAHNKNLTAKHLRQDYRYHNFETFSFFFFQNFIADTMNLFLKLFGKRVYRNQKFMMTSILFYSIP